MINKIYAHIKKYIKENYFFLITLIVLYFVLTFPLPYFIYNGGGLINVGNRVVVGKNKQQQNLNMCYVNQLRGNVATYLFSYIIPGWDLEKIEDTEYDFEEELYRNKILLQESIQNAIRNAFDVSNKEYEITGEKVFVTYIFDRADTNLKVGDQILKLNDNIIHNADELRNLIGTFEVGDNVTFEVLYKEKKQVRSAKVIEIEDKKLTGIGIVTNYSIETDPTVTVNFKSNEAGPSGGLMLALSIYGKLNDDVRYYHKKICGTGTIDQEGNVGEIGGVKYKLKGSVKNGCDIFLSPAGNFKEVKKEKEKNNYNIEIYEAKTFEDTVNYLLNK